MRATSGLFRPQSAAPVGQRLALALLALAVMSGCSSSRYDRYHASSGAYRAPGTSTDPWGPYIVEASRRFSVPQAWIRAVIHQESGGHAYLNGQPITSSAGAMGLMQLMPQTYADMQSRFNLGDDPYEPHDNIMAGTGYIGILNAKYGSPAFLGAYNAGPVRLEDYLYRSRPLPSETVNYIASIAPHLNDAAPSRPSASPAASPVQLAYLPAPIAPASTERCSPDSAYNPAQPCVAELPPPSADDTAPQPPAESAPQVIAAAYTPASSIGRYAIQVGAFAAEGQARFATTIARQADFSALSGAQSLVQPVRNALGNTLYRARLSGLDAQAAVEACRSLAAQSMACIVEPPGH